MKQLFILITILLATGCQSTGDRGFEANLAGVVVEGKLQDDTIIGEKAPARIGLGWPVVSTYFSTEKSGEFLEWLQERPGWVSDVVKSIPGRFNNE